MSRSDCADAQSDLGLRCPHMTEDKFPHGAAPLIIISEALIWIMKVIVDSVFARASTIQCVVLTVEPTETHVS